MRYKALFALLPFLLIASAAKAAYPTDHTYACSWTMGAQKGFATARLSTNGSTWKHGAITTSYPNGTTVQKPVILSHPSYPQPGTTLWLFRQTEDKIKCGLFVLDSGNELVWKDCSNGANQQCVAINPDVRTAVNAANCRCEHLSGAAYADCILNCLGGKFRDGVESACKRDLVSLIKCAVIWWNLNVRPGDGMDVCENPSEEIEELCWGWVNFVERELGGGTCTSSMQCAAGSFCVMNNGSWGCGSLRN